MDQLSAQYGVNKGMMSAMPPMETYPSHYGRLELVIKREPKDHHRARYEREGSRGCIKDVTGDAFPCVQLKGIMLMCPKGSTSVLQVYVAAETGKLRCHPSYRIHPVRSKNCTPCREREIDNILVLELDIRPEADGVVNLDCLGITKLRNADLETAADSEKGQRVREEPLVRLIFRSITSIRGHDGVKQTVVLQVSSSPISCASSPGFPEITLMSNTSWFATGGADVVILGRNFLKDDSRLFVQETTGKYDETILWQQEVQIYRENFQAVHMVAKSTPYSDLLISSPVRVRLVILQRGKSSQPFYFLYVPTTQLSCQCFKLEPICLKENVRHSQPNQSSILNKQLTAREFPERLSSFHDRDASSHTHRSESIYDRRSFEAVSRPELFSFASRKISRDTPDASHTFHKQPNGIASSFSDAVRVDHNLSPPPVILIRQMSHSQSEQNWNVSSVSNSHNSSNDGLLQDDDASSSPECSELLQILLAEIMK